MHVFLIGFMGSGKSSTGKRLARVLGMPFMDIDNEISLEYKMSISDIFSRYDEEVFRMIEKVILRKSATLPEPYVISAGGGTPCFHDNIDFMLEHGLTVYLHLDIPMLVSRIKDSHTRRPLVDTDDQQELTLRVHELFSERERYYRMADIHFDARNLDVNALAQTIREGMKRKKISSGA